MKNALPIALIATASAVLSMPAQAATAVAAAMNIMATVDLDGGIDIVESHAAWGPVLSSLSIGAMAISSDGEGNEAIAQGYGNAGWASDNAGSVSFEGYGWTWNMTGSPPVATGLTGGGPDWSYTFMAGAGDTQFRMDYNVFASGYTFGLQGWQIVVDGGPEGVQVGDIRNVVDPTASGTFLAGLTAGNEYTVTLVNNANLSTQSGFTLDSQMNGNFRWEIVSVPVPEPGTYALMALGLVAVGAVARRRRG